MIVVVIDCRVLALTDISQFLSTGASQVHTYLGIYLTLSCSNPPRIGDLD